MSLRDRFEEIWNDYKYDDTVEGMIDALLTAVCEERGHDFPTIRFYENPVFESGDYEDEPSGKPCRCCGKEYVK